MKIDTDRMLPTINPYKNESAERSGEGCRNGEKVRSGGGDRVDISSSGKNVEQAASGAADGRSEKIAAITEQIRQGTYRVDAELVAKKILEKMGAAGDV